MAKMIKKEKIIVPLKQISALMARFDCKKTAVYNALAYRSQSEQAKSIRQVAIKEHDGRKVTVVTFESEES